MNVTCIQPFCLLPTPLLFLPQDEAAAGSGAIIDAEGTITDAEGTITDGET